MDRTATPARVDQCDAIGNGYSTRADDHPKSMRVEGRLGASHSNTRGTKEMIRPVQSTCTAVSSSRAGRRRRTRPRTLHTVKTSPDATATAVTQPRPIPCGWKAGGQRCRGAPTCHTHVLKHGRNHLGSDFISHSCAEIWPESPRVGLYTTLCAEIWPESPRRTGTTRRSDWWSRRARARSRHDAATYEVATT